MASDHSSDVPVLGILPLQSPPRIHRLQNRRRKSNTETDSDSDSYSMHFPLTTTMTPPRQAGNSILDINEYRRRLEVVKERRARYSTSFPETMSEPAVRESMDYYSTSHEQHYFMPDTVEETFPSSIEISKLETTHKPSAPLNDSPVSTCQTLDEIKRNRNTNIGSTDIWLNSQQHQTHRSPSSRTNAASRRGCAINDSCVSSDYLNLRHLMCNSSERNIDTGFAQITDTICQSKYTKNEEDPRKQYYETMNDDNDAIHGVQSCLEAGAFPGPVSYKSTAPSKDRQNGLLDRLLCSSALSSTPKRSKQGYSSPKRQSYESEYEGFRDGFAVDRTRSIPSHGGSSFNWVRKQDPWYLTSNFTEGSFEEMLVEDSNNLDQKVLDHVMHAVVFVKGDSSPIESK